MTFWELCNRHGCTQQEIYDLAHHLAAYRYKETIRQTIGINKKLLPGLVKEI